MEYEKPVTVIVASAIEAIQSSNQKQHLVILESPYPVRLSTSAAYDADE